MKKLPALSLLLFIASCASLPSPEEMKTETENYVLPAKADKNNALVYVVRPSQIGTLIRFNVFLDDKEDASEMGYTRGSNFIYFSAKPGEHKILSKAENWAEISIKAKVGEIVFIKQNPTFGFIMARNNIEIIDELEGKYHIKNSSLGTILKEKK
jgi:hypothetical protein